MKEVVKKTLTSKKLRNQATLTAFALAAVVGSAKPWGDVAQCMKAGHSSQKYA